MAEIEDGAVDFAFTFFVGLGVTIVIPFRTGFFDDAGADWAAAGFATGLATAFGAGFGAGFLGAALGAGFAGFAAGLALVLAGF